jgi:hypothetical protein
MVAQAAKRPNVSRFGWSCAVTDDKLRCHKARCKGRRKIGVDIEQRGTYCNVGGSMVSNQRSPSIGDQHIWLLETT